MITDSACIKDGRESQKTYRRITEKKWCRKEFGTDCKEKEVNIFLSQNINKKLSERWQYSLWTLGGSSSQHC